MKKILILGANGFLGSHLEHRLKAEGHFVVSVGRSRSRYRESVADEYHYCDLSSIPGQHHHIRRHHYDELYQLAGSVGGLGYIGTGDNDAEILTNSIKINLHTLEAVRFAGSVERIFFASSQCVYPDIFDVDPFANERLTEMKVSAPRETDASFNTFAFGQEKLYAEKLYDAYARNHGFDIRIGRLGNTYGPYCTWGGSRAKVVAALCRKVAEAPYAGAIDIWGSGEQRRSFTYVDDAVDGMIRLMASNCDQPVNIAHDETVSILELIDVICNVAGKLVGWKSVEGPEGVQSRGSDNSFCRAVLGWQPSTSLWEGLKRTYPWIAKQVLTPDRI